MRWKTWMRGFWGVGIAYMDNYIAWFIFMENEESNKNRYLLNEAIMCEANTQMEQSHLKTAVL